MNKLEIFHKYNSNKYFGILAFFQTVRLEFAIIGR